MKIFRRCFYALASVALLTACSDDPLQENGVDGGSSDNAVTGDGVYVTINIDLPSASGSRSVTDSPDENRYTTSDAGVEIGKDYENNISTAIVVLAETTTNKFIAAAPVTGLNDISSDKSAYQAKSKFSKTALKQWYDTNPKSFNCNIFIFANPTEEINTKIFGSETVVAPAVGSSSWINAICAPAKIEDICIVNKFLMSNAKVATREIPHSLDAWNTYSDPSHAFDLSGDNIDVNIYNDGPVRLERAAARFDFRDASPLYAESADATNAFRYHVVYSEAKNDKGELPTTAFPIIDIKLSTMSLVNVDKSFFAIRRVSTTGSDTPSTVEPLNTVTICGAEQPWIKGTNDSYTSGNYIVDATYTWKQGAANTLTGNPNATIEYNKYFFYPFFNNDGSIDNLGQEDVADYSDSRWLTMRCDQVVKGTSDNNQSWNSGNTLPSYKIWTYAHENVIANVDDQINGLSTGVVFKGKMGATSEAVESKDKDISELAATINNEGNKLGNPDSDPIIYEFAGNLYLTWNKIRDAAVAAAAPKVTWIPEDETDLTKGHWELSVNDIDRKNSLYVAVFGTGGFGKFEFTYWEYTIEEDGTKKPVLVDEKKVYHTGEIIDNLPVDPNSADYAWSQWHATQNSMKDATLKAAYKKAVTDADITIYQSGYDKVDKWGYYCYYYYWNRHNDNGNNGVMGPMEFAVVRNNVYKLAVTSIDRLGHPRLSENDPNRPTGGTKDENEDVYITVTAQVLPWIVRLNNIQF